MGFSKLYRITAHSVRYLVLLDKPSGIIATRGKRNRNRRNNGPQNIRQYLYFYILSTTAARAGHREGGTDRSRGIMYEKLILFPQVI
jgi:hypothetical protein